MKLFTLKRLMVLSLLFLAGNIIAQPPPGINFQAVAKDPLNNPAKNRTVYVKDIIYQKSISGTRVWEETHVTTSDADGIFLIVLGQGTIASGINIKNIGEIPWSDGPFFLNTKIAVAPSIPATWWVAADNYIDMGTTQMQSVPYALFAGNASVTNVNTSITPGPFNTFLITDSSGNVSWAKPQAAQQAVTTISNFNLNLNLNVINGQSVTIPPLTTAVVTVTVNGVRKGDPIIVTPQDDYKEWSIYSSWVIGDNLVGIRLANYTNKPVLVDGSQYKIVVIK